MRGAWATLILMVASRLFAGPAASDDLIVFSPDPLIGVFIRSHAALTLFLGSGSGSASRQILFVQAGQRVSISAATPDERWYRVRWRESPRSEAHIGWLEASHFEILGRQSAVGAPAWDAPSPVSAEDERRAPDERAQRQAEAERRQAEGEERARKQAEAAARQAQRAAEREAQAAERDRARLYAEAEARWREGERRLRAQRERERAEQVAREQMTRQEQEAREREETRRLEAKRKQERRARARHAEQNRMLFFALAALYGAFCFLPFFPLYRDFMDTPWKPAKLPGVFIAIFLSAGCFLGVVWMVDTVSLVAIPDFLLLLAFLGLYFWFFVPGFLVRIFIFLHSLLVPHPLEIAFQRVLRGETVSRAEAAEVEEAIRRFYRNGSPADWRVKSALARLDRLAKLMGRENAFVDFLSDAILHQHDQNGSGRRSTP